ncbi:MAG: NAD(P) transhydrogenase subunit alpha [Dongiaceae bacterium]
MDPATLAEKAVDIANQAKDLANQAAGLATQAGQISGAGPAEHSFVALFSVFVLACFVGYHVVWRVTPALHSPLMSVTNAISSVIIVGALIAAGTGKFGFSEVMGFIAIALASVNIFGGFLVTHRMLSMFKKKQK